MKDIDLSVFILSKSRNNMMCRLILLYVSKSEPGKVVGKLRQVFSQRSSEQLYLLAKEAKFAGTVSLLVINQ